VNPEFHGWWAGRGFSINVDVATGQLVDMDDFLRHFYACYHPYYNGNQPLIHPQPAGVAVTDSAARFVGWHAITILRVALDPSGAMRVYFFNPNNDSGQDWGDGVRVSTSGNGERYGESSLLFAQFASRLYIFHYDPLEGGELAAVERDELDEVMGYIRAAGAPIGQTDYTITTGSVGALESVIAVDLRVADMAELNAQWEKLAQREDHKAWARRSSPWW
jgi:hypothetical protein